MRRIFIDVDTQNDFCSSTGALSVCSLSSDIIKQCKHLVNHAIDERQLILGSVDSHAYDAWEFYINSNKGPNGEKPNFPPHCVKGTNGWLKVSGTLPDRFKFVPNTPISHVELREGFYHPSVQALYFEKEVYSLFANPNAGQVLFDLVALPVIETQTKEEVEFIVFGVATDYCVRAAVIGLLRRINGHDSLELSKRTKVTVKVVKDAIAAVKEADGELAISDMEKAGAVFIEAKEITGIELPKPTTKKSGK